MREHTTHTYILSVMQRSCKVNTNMFGYLLQEDVSGPGSERHNFNFLRRMEAMFM